MIYINDVLNENTEEQYLSILKSFCHNLKTGLVEGAPFHMVLDSPYKITLTKTFEKDTEVVERINNNYIITIENPYNTRDCFNQKVIPPGSIFGAIRSYNTSEEELLISLIYSICTLLISKGIPPKSIRVDGMGAIFIYGRKVFTIDVQKFESNGEHICTLAGYIILFEENLEFLDDILQMSSEKHYSYLKEFLKNISLGDFKNFLINIPLE